jgi:hypothetical protein
MSKNKKTNKQDNLSNSKGNQEACNHAYVFKETISHSLGYDETIYICKHCGKESVSTKDWDADDKRLDILYR